MQIIANGKTIELAEPCTVQQYIEQNNYVPEQIAVELNERIVPRTHYAVTHLHTGDILEIVMFMGGGSPCSI